jgi:hypothetical protein
VSQAPRQERQEESSAAYLPVRGGTVRGSRWVRWALLLGLVAFASIFVFADPKGCGRAHHADPWLPGAAGDLRPAQLR